MEERKSCFTAADAVRIWLRQFALVTHGVLLVKWRQMKIFKCLSVFKLIFFLSLVSFAFLPYSLLSLFLTLKSYFYKIVILFFKPCLYQSLSQREWKKCVLLTVTKLANKSEVKICIVLCIVLLGGSLTLSKTVSGILQPHNFGEAS